MGKDFLIQTKAGYDFEAFNNDFKPIYTDSGVVEVSADSLKPGDFICLPRQQYFGNESIDNSYLKGYLLGSVSVVMDHNFVCFKHPSLYNSCKVYEEAIALKGYIKREFEVIDNISYDLISIPYSSIYTESDKFGPSYFESENKTLFIASLKLICFL